MFLLLRPLTVALLLISVNTEAGQSAWLFPHIPLFERCIRSLWPDTPKYLTKPYSNKPRPYVPQRVKPPDDMDLERGLNWWLNLDLDVLPAGYGSRKIRTLILDRKIKTRADLLKLGFDPASPYYQLLLEANPQFLENLKFPDSLGLTKALTKMYEKNRIPIEKRIYPGRIYLDPAGKYHFLKEAELGQAQANWTVVEGVTSNDVFFDALAHGVHPMSTKFLYEEIMSMTINLHELGHFAGYTNNRYNSWIHEYLIMRKLVGTDLPSKETGDLFELAYEMSNTGKRAVDSVIVKVLNGKNLVIDPLAYVTREAKKELKAYYLFNDLLDDLNKKALIEVAEDALEIVDSNLTLYGGSHLDQFTSRNRYPDELFKNAQLVQRQLESYRWNKTSLAKYEWGVLRSYLAALLVELGKTRNQSALEHAIETIRALTKSASPN